MKNLIYKEFKLAMPLLTVAFIAFALMTFIPGYPILCGAFFVCFGIFQSYQTGREDNDILYSVLLPVRKTDVVRAKYATTVILQMLAFFFCTVFTLIRMIALSEAKVYTTNALMAANFVFLAFVLLIFTAFNVIFLGGFFKTAYGIGKPFVVFVIANFTIIGIAEALHHFPGLSWLNAMDFSYIGRHSMILGAAVIMYIVVTTTTCKISQKRFEKIDL